VASIQACNGVSGSGPWRASQTRSCSKPASVLENVLWRTRPPISKAPSDLVRAMLMPRMAMKPPSRLPGSAAVATLVIRLSGVPVPWIRFGPETDRAPLQRLRRRLLRRRIAKRRWPNLGDRYEIQETHRLTGTMPAMAVVDTNSTCKGDDAKRPQGPDARLDRVKPGLPSEQHHAVRFRLCINLLHGVVSAGAPTPVMDR